MIPFLFIALSPTSSVETAPSADTAAGVIAQKLRMKNRYTLRLRIEARTPTAPPPFESASSSTLHLWRDGNKFRVDYFDAQYTPQRLGHDSRSRRVTCENCERAGYGITTTILPDSPTVQPMVEFHRLGTRNFDVYCTHFDWRYFGLGNDRPCGYKHLQIGVEFPKFFKQAGVVTKTENRGDIPCLVAAVKTAKYDQSVWLSEREGFNPVYFEEVMRFDNVPDVRATKITWQQTAGGHYYPRTVKHNTIISVNSGKHASEEVITVTHADFDSPIDPAVFTLAGFGLNDNQAIGLPGLEHRDHPLWRNGKVDYSYTVRNQMEESSNSRPIEGGQSLPAAYPSQGNIALVVSIVAAVLAVATAVAAIVIRRRRAA